MERTLKQVTKNGVIWTYRPGFVYTGRYRGWTVCIRRVPATKGWRLFVTRGGGSIAFKKQFYETVDDARKAGLRMVDEKAAA